MSVSYPFLVEIKTLPNHGTWTPGGHYIVVGGEGEMLLVVDDDKTFHEVKRSRCAFVGIPPLPVMAQVQQAAPQNRVAPAKILTLPQMGN